ncbi:hypothetical protein KI387_015649 [Taxus chinensis]|uniref:Terpene synthase metal-binding domain-containing protein n=1 Tax=Taxus chinensis TaxID=29808 RepID=A0AA38GFG2_TAXCH|nr:hypothetical protein KI387_015649 [Taxus chinensis]
MATAEYRPSMWNAYAIRRLTPTHKSPVNQKRMKTLIKEIRNIFQSIEDRKISPSAYDTAWIARIPAIDNPSQPQFPQTLKWVVSNQLADGSWEEESFYFPYDRLLSTLSCVITLRIWKIEENQVQKGIDFVNRQIQQIDGGECNMPSGFVTHFSSLLREAHTLSLGIYEEAPLVKRILTTGDTEMKGDGKMDDNLPSYFLSPWEDLQDWKQIGKVCSKDGSIIGSSAFAARAFMHSGDTKCLDFINSLLGIFGEFGFGTIEALEREVVIPLPMSMIHVWDLEYSDCMDTLFLLVEYVLKYGFHRNLPRLETRFYIEHFGITNDVRFPCIRNEKYLELAKLDFNVVQTIHQKELQQVHRWWIACDFRKLKFTRERHIEIYFAVAAGMFEPEYSDCRISFTKIGCLLVVLDDLYDKSTSHEDIKLFNEEFNRWDLNKLDQIPEHIKICYMGLYNTINELGKKASKVQGRDMLQYFRKLIDYRSKALDLVCLTTRLINDTKTFKDEREFGELASAIECYMKDNVGASEEEALGHVYNVIEGGLVELNKELFMANQVPDKFRKLLLNSARTSQLFYMQVDAVNNSNLDKKDMVEKCIFQGIV